MNTAPSTTGPGGPEARGGGGGLPSGWTGGATAPLQPLPHDAHHPPQPVPRPGSLTKFCQWESVSQRVWRQRRSRKGTERRKERERKDGEIGGPGEGEGLSGPQEHTLLQRNSPFRV